MNKKPYSLVLSSKYLPIKCSWYSKIHYLVGSSKNIIGGLFTSSKAIDKRFF